jgi:hypothetical protein
MNGYGQLQYDDSLINALAQQDHMMQQQQMIDNAMNQNWGAAGQMGVLAKALMGARQGYLNNQMRDRDIEIQREIARIQQETQAAADARAQAEYQRKIEREDAKEARKRQYQIDDRNFKAQQDAMNYQRGVDTYNARRDEQRQYDAKLLADKIERERGVPKKLSAIEQKVENAIQRGDITEDRGKEILLQDLNKGSKPKELSSEIKNKLGLLKTAEENLDAYINQAFVDGDYQEFGSMFGDTNDKLNAAFQNTLRAESGAVIGKDEIEQFEDTYAPSMFRSDETNWKKVHMLKDKIKNQRESLLGQSQTAQEPEANINNDAVKNLAANYTPQQLAQMRQLKLREMGGN